MRGHNKPSCYFRREPEVTGSEYRTSQLPPERNDGLCIDPHKMRLRPAYINAMQAGMKKIKRRKAYVGQKARKA